VDGRAILIPRESAYSGYTESSRPRSWLFDWRKRVPNHQTEASQPTRAFDITQLGMPAVCSLSAKARPVEARALSRAWPLSDLIPLWNHRFGQFTPSLVLPAPGDKISAHNLKPYTSTAAITKRFGLNFAGGKILQPRLPPVPIRARPVQPRAINSVASLLLGTRPAPRPAQRASTTTLKGIMRYSSG